jgi:hypothetical protein
VDEKFLEEHKLSADEFIQIVKGNPNDGQMIEAIKSLKK